MLSTKVARGLFIFAYDTGDLLIAVNAEKDWQHSTAIAVKDSNISNLRFRVQFIATRNVKVGSKG